MPKQTTHIEMQTKKLDENIQPYASVLKEYFPTREEILYEAQALTQKNLATRKRNLKNASLGTVLSLLIAATWMLDPVLQSDYLTTGIGQTQVYNMADGSTITLNTNTIVQAENRLLSRQVKLLQGEALFNVAHGWRSFTVQANDTHIRDIGTAFNVFNTNNGAIVTVLEGSVEVTIDNKNQLLTQNQTLQTSINQFKAPATVDTSTITAWQQGNILFDGTPLGEAVKEMQRYRKAPIILNDTKAAKLRISGAYDIKGIESLLDTLPISVAVKVNRNINGSVEITSR
jgi:transmembrane sensor